MRLGALLLALLVVALPATAAFAPIQVLPMATRAASTYVFTQVTVPTGVIGARLLLDVSQATDPLPTLSGQLEGSVDGTNWGVVGTFSRPAGNRGTDLKGPVTQVGFEVGGGTFWNDSGNANRRLRGGATLGGSMRFAMTVTPL